LKDLGPREKENTTTGFIEQPTESLTEGPLFCSTCGVTLAPVETTLDLGDGPELLCDGCLGIHN